MNLSVIICTHNPRADYLRKTLDGLKDQTLPKDQWELLLIDNASKAALSSKNWDLSWHPNGRLVREEALGLTFARLRGIKESRGDLLLFVDDDNILEPNYCENLLKIVGDYPNLGCIGAGIIEPEYEITPPVELVPYLPSLALRTEAKAIWSNRPVDNFCPYGAGLAVPKTVANEYYKIVIGCQFRQKLDRVGKQLNSGGDDEFSWIACDLGLGKGLFPELRMRHLIDARRLNKEYLVKLFEGNAYSHEILDWLHGLPSQGRDDSRPGIYKVIRALLLANYPHFLYEGERLLKFFRSSRMEREFEDARIKGRMRANESINYFRRLEPQIVPVGKDDHLKVI